ncbi:MAG: GIY-YIG nuclease family protein [Balneolaceae bacterium]|nr:GIY-YIG nuclease family protein [Balneolaceae bacterium]
MHHTYIIYSSSRDRYYVGHTSYTPFQRVEQHNNASTPSTIPGIPWTVVFCKPFTTKSEAIRFELFIKRQKSRRFIKKLIQSEENHCWEKAR